MYVNDQPSYPGPCEHGTALQQPDVRSKSLAAHSGPAGDFGLTGDLNSFEPQIADSRHVSVLPRDQNRWRQLDAF
jgi:hypothetical protein